MELLDRYLQAVKKYLPWQRQDDVIAELRANLEAQLEDKEAALGRPLTRAEAEAWLKQIGPPIQVAGRYQPQQFLIGPAVFPMYRYVLQLAFTWALIIYAVVSAVQIAVAQNFSGTAVLEAVLRLPGMIFAVAFWVTLIFAVVEFAARRYPGKCPQIAGLGGEWNPGTLPPLAKEVHGGTKPRSYAHAVAEVVFGFLFLIWLLLIPHYPYLLMGPGAAYMQASPFHWAPVWVQVYWWIVALNIAQLCWHCADLWRGAWQRPQPVKHIAIKAFGLIPLALVLAAPGHTLVILRHPALDQAQYGRAVDSMNQALYMGLSVVCAIVVLQLAWDLGRFGLAAYRKRAAM